MSDHRDSHKVALVTGASRNIGRAIALELAELKYDLVLSARTLAVHPGGLSGSLEETARAVRAAGGRVELVRADLSKLDEVERLATRCVEQFGGVDLLVNNAAFLGKASRYSLDQLSLQDWQRQLAVNLTAPFLLCKLVAPHMRRQGGGVIINITSGAAEMEPPVPVLAYATTKAALNRLTRALARELQDAGIAVLALDPGSTRTEIVEQVSEATGMAIEHAHPPEVPAAAVAAILRGGPMRYTGRILKLEDVGETA